MKGRISEKEVDELRQKRLDIVDAVDSIKLGILGILKNVVERNFGFASQNEKLVIIKNLFIIVTSSIENLDAKIVEV